ncbi:Rhamnulokinase [Lactococcus cremoris]|uniref:Rhamnulokinase n=1 Tax=Lactococcus lactis subsp. cremoris TaxID=1359 RepID=A0A166JNP3_LACLC|nr:rhamnulokinase [Lactococcus cremoris]KZK06455.1 Rhamnulokinase [Lactococcus cremoris]
MDYIAIDIGASSGRLIHAHFTELGGYVMNEIHRFKNGFHFIEGKECWNISALVVEILRGLEKAKQQGIAECYIGIDTWGVDYCLIDKKGELISEAISYRDKRTQSAIQDFENKFPLDELYKKTGIQLQTFNTIFQLLNEDKEHLRKADKLLLIPDYLGYIFTGTLMLEQTNASTMQLLNLKTRQWDLELLKSVNINPDLLPPVVEAGQIMGKLQQEKFKNYDLPEATFISVASHDTASAVVGTPGIGEDWAFISSGTWSLLGTELPEGISNEEAFEANFTNEWGINGSIRFIKNIMGMWLIQEVARVQDYQYSYEELSNLAAKERAFQQFIDINDARFLNPENMIEEIQSYCRESNQLVPETPGQIARCIYDNLALCYSIELEKLKKITGKKIKKLHLVGGGANNKLLNQITANVCNIIVETGPSEATAVGNLMVQMMATQRYESLAAAREDIQNVTELKLFRPSHTLIEVNAMVKYKEIFKK